MNRIIISKEEEREDPRRDSSIYLRVVFPQIIQELQDSFEYSVFYSVSTRNPATPSNSAYRINSSTRNTTTTRLIPCRPLQGIFQQLFPVSPSILHGRTRLLQHSKRSIHKQASSNSTRQKQHSTRQPASTQSLQQFPGQVLHYRILPGFIPKGLSIVCPCNTKVSVFQFTYSCFRIILQEY